MDRQWFLFFRTHTCIFLVQIYAHVWYCFFFLIYMFYWSTVDLQSCVILFIIVAIHEQRTCNCPLFLFSYIAHAAPLQPIIIKRPILTQVPFNCQLTSFSQVLHEWTPRNTPGIFPRYQRPLFLYPLGYLLSSPYPFLCNICYHSNILSSWISSFPSFPTELWLCSLLFVFSLVLTISFLGGPLFFSPLSNPSFESSVQFSWSVMSDSLPLHWTATCQASLSITNSRSLLKLMSIKLVMPSNHLILCHPLLLVPSVFPSIRVFSNESVLLIRWPKYWSFSFSFSPSNEYLGLISFRDGLVWSRCSPRDSQESSPTPLFKSILTFLKLKPFCLNFFF